MRKRTYTTDEVCQMVGITYRQLDYWVRRGWVQPSLVKHQSDTLDPATTGPPGTGHWRRWTRADVERVRTVSEAFDRAIAVLGEAGITITRRGLASAMGANGRRAS